MSTRISFSRFFCASASELVSGKAASSSEAVESEKTRAERLKKKELYKEISLLGPLNVFDVLPKLRTCRWAKFDETLEIAVNTYLDPRKPNQSVKGVASLPHGNGKKVRIAVFAAGADAQAALDAGADIVGTDDLIARVQSGDIPFDRAIGNFRYCPSFI
jgi:ribosomal protein L1